MIKTIIENKETIWEIISSIIVIAAAVSAMTKNEDDNKFMDKVYKFINILGLNIGKAKNKWVYSFGPYLRKVKNTQHGAAFPSVVPFTF